MDYFPAASGGFESNSKAMTDGTYLSMPVSSPVVGTSHGSAFGFSSRTTSRAPSEPRSEGTVRIGGPRVLTSNLGNVAGYGGGSNASSNVGYSHPGSITAYPVSGSYVGSVPRSGGVASELTRFSEADKQLLAGMFEQEREEQMHEMQEMRGELNAQQAMLAQIAEKLLGGTFDAALEDLRRTMTCIEEEQDLQAGCLREALIGFEKQQTSIEQMQQSRVAESDPGNSFAVSTAQLRNEAAFAQLRCEVLDMHGTLDATKKKVIDQVDKLVMQLEARLLDVCEETLAQHGEKHFRQAKDYLAEATAKAAAASASGANFDAMSARLESICAKQCDELVAAQKNEFDSTFVQLWSEVSDLRGAFDSTKRNIMEETADIMAKNQENSAREITDLRSCVDFLRQMSEESSLDLAQVRVAVDGTDKFQKELAQITASVEALERQSGQSTRELAQLRFVVDDLERNVEQSHSTQGAQITREVADLRLMLGAIVESSEQTSQEVAQLKSSVDLAHQNSDESKKALTTLGSSVDLLKLNSDKFPVNLTEFRSAFDDLSKDVVQLDTSVKALLQDSRKSTHEITQLKSSVDLAHKNYEQSTQQLDTVRSSVHLAHENTQQSTRELSDLRSSVERAKDRNSDLSSEELASLRSSVQIAHQNSERSAKDVLELRAALLSFEGKGLTKVSAAASSYTSSEDIDSLRHKLSNAEKALEDVGASLRTHEAKIMDVVVAVEMERASRADQVEDICAHVKQAQTQTDRTSEVIDALSNEMRARTAELANQLQNLTVKTGDQEIAFMEELQRLSTAAQTSQSSLEVSENQKIIVDTLERCVKASEASESFSSTARCAEANARDAAASAAAACAEVAAAVTKLSTAEQKNSGGDTTAVGNQFDVEETVASITERALEALEQRAAQIMTSQMSSQSEDSSALTSLTEDVRGIQAKISRLESTLHRNVADELSDKPRAIMTPCGGVPNIPSLQQPTPKQSQSESLSQPQQQDQLKSQYHKGPIRLQRPLGSASASVPVTTSEAPSSAGSVVSSSKTTMVRSSNLSESIQSVSTTVPLRSGPSPVTTDGSVTISSRPVSAWPNQSLSPTSVQTRGSIVLPRPQVRSIPAAIHGLVEPARCLAPAGQAATTGQVFGKRRALVVGCGCGASGQPLIGCANDTWSILSLFRHTLQYAEDQVRLLLDSSELPRKNQPTHEGIFDGLQWLLKDAGPGDEFFFYFSGYGTQQPKARGGGILSEGFLVPSDFGDDVPNQVMDFVRSSVAASDSTRSTAPEEVWSAPIAAASYRLVSLADVASNFARLPSSCRVTVVLDCALGHLPGSVAADSGDPVPPAFPRVHIEHPQMSDGRSGKCRFLNLPPLQPRPLPDNVEVALGPSSCPVFVFSAGQQTRPCVEQSIEGAVQGSLTWSFVKSLMACRLRPTVQQHEEQLKLVFGTLEGEMLTQQEGAFLSTSPAANVKEGLLRRDDTAKGFNVNGLVVAGTNEVASFPGRRPSYQGQGQRKALIVGVNYKFSHAPLKGCVNDAWNMYSLLRDSLQFDEDRMRILVDESGDHPLPCEGSLAPTKANIQAGLQWLAAGARPGDTLVFVFCGYGAQHPQTPGNIAHEAYLVPVDFTSDLQPSFFGAGGETSLAGVSTGGSTPAKTGAYRLVPTMEISSILGTLPAGIRATVILDCSYSLLPLVSSTVQNSSTFLKVNRGRVDYRKLRDFMSRPRFLDLPPLPVALTPPSYRNAKPPECQVHCFSACRNTEWDAEMPIEGTVQGAFVWAFVKAFAALGYNCSLQNLQKKLEEITADLKLRFKGVEQTPVLQLSRASSLQDFVLSG